MATEYIDVQQAAGNIYHRYTIDQLSPADAEAFNAWVRNASRNGIRQLAYRRLSPSFGEGGRITSDPSEQAIAHAEKKEILTERQYEEALLYLWATQKRRSRAALRTVA